MLDDFLHLARTLSEWVRHIWNEKTPEHVKTFSTILSVLLALVTLVKLLSALYGRLTLDRKQAQIRAAFPNYLEAYRKKLAERALQDNRPWVPHSGPLDDLLVRAQVDAQGGVRDLQQWLHQSLSDEDSNEIFALTGPVGSGKSIALVLAMEVAWNIRKGSERGPVARMSKRLPLLVTFVDLRAENFDVLAALKSSLVSRRFAASESNQLEICELFLQDMLEERRLLVLADGLDEIASDQQRTALKRLIEFAAGTGISCIFASRDGALESHKSLTVLQRCVRLRLQEFGLATIERYIRRWPFSQPGLADAVVTKVREDVGFARLCANPQLAMLICFLHSEDPFPGLSRRAVILEQCVSRLLQRSVEFAQVKPLDPWHKRRLLSRLAYACLEAGHSPDDMPEATVTDRLTRDLAELGLVDCPAVTVLDDLVRHTGLVRRTDSGSVRFVHQSFFEYFVAAYLKEIPAGNQRLLERWRADSIAREEIVLAYAGLSKTADPTLATIVEQATPVTALFLLAELSEHDFDLTQRTIERALTELAAQPLPGHFQAICQFMISSAHARASKNDADGDWDRLTADCEAALVSAFTQTRGNEALRQLRNLALRALLLARPLRGVELLLEAVSEIDLSYALALLNPDMLAQVRSNLSRRFDDKALLAAWIDALKIGQRPEELGRTFLMLTELEDLQFCALAFISLSRVDEFWTVLDEIPTERLLRIPGIRETLDRWQWPWPGPITARGRVAAVALARLAADHIGKLARPFQPLQVLEVDHHLYYLTHALAWERFYGQDDATLPSEDVALLVGMVCQSTPRLLRKVWHHRDREFGDPERGFTEALRMVLACCPTLLMAWCAWDFWHSGNLRSGATLTILLLTIAAAWVRVATRSEAQRYELSWIDLAISSLAGSVAVLKEVRFLVLRKRQDDAFALAFCGALSAGMLVIATIQNGIGARALALASLVHVLWECNKLVGLHALASHQAHVLSRFLHHDTSGAVQ